MGTWWIFSYVAIYFHMGTCALFISYRIVFSASLSVFHITLTNSLVLVIYLMVYPMLFLLFEFLSMHGLGAVHTATTCIIFLLSRVYQSALD